MRRRWYDFPIREWLLDVILKPLAVMAFPVAVSFLLQRIPVASVWLRMILWSAVSFLVCAACVYFILLERQERDFLLSQVLKLKNP